MQTIVYSTHTPENHLLIANRVRKERPNIYLDESSEVLNPAYEAFLRDKSMTTRELDQRCAALGWNRIEYGVDQIYLAVREVGARIIGVEDEKAAKDYLVYQANEIAGFAWILSGRLGGYQVAKRVIASGKQPTTRSLDEILGGGGSFDLDELMLATMLQDPQVVVKEFESGMAELKDKLSIFVGKEIERDTAIAERIARLGNDGIFGYFGFAHRTISHILSKSGIVIPYEFAGQIVLDPETKYCMIIKYDMLDLDPKELRSPDPTLDCDPEKKEFYLSIIPHWVFFDDFNKKRATPDERVKFFWANLDTILGSP